MEELKKLTTEELMKVSEEINKELHNRKNEERENAYRNLINAMKKFQDSEFFKLDECLFEAYCEDCEKYIDFSFFDCFNSIIIELERKI